jgi:hypothetical protein
LAAHADDPENEAGGQVSAGRRISGFGPARENAEALQFAGWIGLYRGEEDWFYRVRSDQEQIVNSLVSRQETS